MSEDRLKDAKLFSQEMAEQDYTPLRWRVALIHIGHLISEVERLREALGELCRWKRPDGDCWCETPNAHSPGCIAAKEALATSQEKK